MREISLHLLDIAENSVAAQSHNICIEINENLKSDFNVNGKTPSMRLRSVLFIGWEQKPEGYKTFVDYYNATS